MRIVSLTIENFRSITTAKQIPFDDYTLFVGPNNEGKSNILRALNLAMTTLQNLRTRNVRLSDGTIKIIPPEKRYVFNNSGFNYSKDFPLYQSRKKSNKCSNITIEFKLDEGEIGEFYKKIGSNLNGTLPIKISFAEKVLDITIAKPGKGHATLNKKITRITGFISNRIKFDYVPAVRTAGSADEVVRTLVANELTAVENDQRYINALAVIEDLQRPVLESLSNSITETVASFLPSVKEISLRASQSTRANLLRRAVQIDVNDGVLTELGQKGDGVQSLVALALMRYASEGEGTNQNSIVAIEEPESHLHPKAVRDLRDVIFSLSSKNQVIVSSHSPLLVKWEGNTSTIIVGENKATKAKNIAEVRDSLGVLVSDNLTTAEFTLIVEGVSDRKILTKIILERGNEKIKTMLLAKRFIIKAIGGASKLSYSIASSEQNIIGFHVFFDADAPGQAEITKALNSKLLKESEYNICACAGMKESEIEDIVNQDIYASKIKSKYSVDILGKNFKGNEKWSKRMKSGFEAEGKIWTEELQNDLKIIIADCFAASPTSKSIIEQKSTSIVALLNSLQLRLG